ncbi:DUF2721 domain-containing protein [Candidatus Methylospira mobilis]|uniref:DUF2721 domain-containing protein n=1 Tax=Candidatus Methylospira mobilis TaxID=1808979 RepID=A0A5Q0BIZ1_9GAMM|nr:DUF2721 domain-containing protein [Candidatus Methylospira mobilis]QFY43092.1 DUF2721 domain-containing protein [Candidatus Methylospira mobilis]WNV03764.1 DUF2721 domain-containing protein [Candidatus Methylospira mobilis]
MPELLDQIVNLVIHSLVLFSSLGIFVLTLNARYIHAVFLLRGVHGELKTCQKSAALEMELNSLIYRCRLLKWSFVLILCSAMSSCIFLMSSIFFRMIDNTHIETLIVSIVASVFFILSSMILLLMEVISSFKDTLIHIGHIEITQESQ